VIHIIDHVLTIPPTYAEAATAAGLSSLVGALNATGLMPISPNVTLFAPNNAAFQAIAGGLSNLTTDQIRSVLTYHAVVGNAPGYSSGLTNGTVLKTVNGANLTITINSGRVFVNGARVVTPDVLVANGVIHVIDAYVLFIHTLSTPQADHSTVFLTPAMLPSPTPRPPPVSLPTPAPLLPPTLRK
jgi:uncharacterized surface protein with fasciclin (FAS1) repeats